LHALSDDTSVSQGLDKQTHRTHTETGTTAGHGADPETLDTIREQRTQPSECSESFLVSDEMNELELRFVSFFGSPVENLYS
jgi:hypothetical protein